MQSQVKNVQHTQKTSKALLFSRDEREICAAIISIKKTIIHARLKKLSVNSTLESAHWKKLLFSLDKLRNMESLVNKIIMNSPLIDKTSQ